MGCFGGDGSATRALPSEPRAIGTPVEEARRNLDEALVHQGVYRDVAPAIEELIKVMLDERVAKLETWKRPRK